jgi:KRAB domain-containing zinc finger protein
MKTFTNSPSFQNTISNISFKCDVCSQIFSHLTLLNQHKRTHNQDESHNETVTVVTQNQGIIQAQNLISESGQNLGQIQIVAAESLEPAQLHHSIGDQINMVHQQPTQKGDKHKCITCGGHIQQNAKRKGPKLIRCENCIQNDTNTQNVRPTQIFVSPDGDIKFEVNEVNQNVIQIQGAVQKIPTKKKNVTTVTKCTTCNGTGVVIVTETPPASSPVTSAQSTKMTTARTVTSNSPQKIQHVQIQHVNKESVSPPPIQIHHQVQHHAPPANQVARQSE